MISAIHTAGFYDLCLWASERLRHTLLPIFQRSVPSATTPTPLSSRHITLGGVENTGNSCIFSVMLQDFAALPDCYDSFLKTPLQKGPDEADFHFEKRKQAIAQLKTAIEKIRKGKCVSAQEIRSLAQILQDLGWEGSVCSYWRRILYTFFPHLFPLPFFSVFALYDKMLSLLLMHFPYEQAKAEIILLGQDSSTETFSQIIEKGLKNVMPQTQHLFWRIAPQKQMPLEDNFQKEGLLFSLKLVHVYKENHVLLYQKKDSGWIVCNDTDIHYVESLPPSSICLVVYESYPFFN